MTGGGFLELENGANDTQRFIGQARILGPKSFRYFCTTISLLGVQIFWSVEMSYASPYLLSLGVSKSHMAVVFLAGPLSGLVMQPLIGVLADNNTSRLGRRRPYMFVATLICVVGMLLLGWTRQVASWFTSTPDALTIGLAVFSIYLIDFGINAVQAVDRALIVDTLPSAEQPKANAWAACMLGLGSVIGFFVGNLNLPGIFPFLGNSQIAVLSVIGSILLFVCQSTTVLFVRERVLLKSSGVNGDGSPASKSLRSEVKEIFANILTLPRVIRQICMIQFFSWLAWFPLLFYTTMYIGDLHKRAFYANLGPNSPKPSEADLATLNAEATRLGSRALFYSSIVTLAGNLLLPFFISKRLASEPFDNLRPTRPSTPAAWHIPNFLRLSLASLWAVGQAVYTACMLGTFFTSSVPGATFLITLTGLSWAVTQWVPFALLAEAILTDRLPQASDDAGSIQLTDTRTRSGRDVQYFRHQEGSPSDQQQGNSRNSGESDPSLPETLAKSPSKPSSGAVQDYSIGNEDEEDENSNLVGRAQASADDDAQSGDGNLSSKAGIILGIHNIFIVVPQFLVTGLASLIFALLDPEKSVLHGSHPGKTSQPSLNATTSAATHATSVIARDEAESSSNSVVLIFRIGGVAALIAFLLCCRLSKELRHR